MEAFCTVVGFVTREKYKTTPYILSLALVIDVILVFFFEAVWSVCLPLDMQGRQHIQKQQMSGKLEGL